MILRRDPGRTLTPGERALAAEMFGAALDPTRVRLHRARWWPFQPRDVVMAPDGDIWIHPASSAWAEDYARAGTALQALFVHELTHCWQVQRGGRFYLLLMRHPFCRYRFTMRPGKPFRRYGIEQQAEIVRALFLLRRTPGRDPGLCAAYAALLPFSAGPG